MDICKEIKSVKIFDGDLKKKKKTYEKMVKDYPKEVTSVIESR